MENIDYLKDLLPKIEPYNTLDLTAKIAALQLCPENADYILRIEALAHAVNCISFNPEKPISSRHRFTQFCLDPILGSRIIAQEDPSPNPFTESITFFNGSYIVFPGQLIDPVFVIKQLFKSIFLSEQFSEDTIFLNRIYKFSSTVLWLSNEIANRAGLIRNLAPKQNSGNIFIPLNINSLQQAVIFNIEETNNMLFEKKLSLNYLSPIIQQDGNLTSDSYTIQDSPLHLSPIINFGNEIIIAEPSMLLAALINQIMIFAKEYGVITKLHHIYEQAIINIINSTFTNFNYKPINKSSFLPNENLSFVDGFWGFDTDKIIYSTLILDDFSDYENNLFLDEKHRVDTYIYEQRFAEIQQLLFSSCENLQEVFFIVVIAGIGRNQFLGFNLEYISQKASFLAIGVYDLEILSNLYPNDSFLLYKFAKSSNNIRESSKVITFSTLDEFVFYRKHDFSYYLSDDYFFDFINIPVGIEKEIKIEYIQKLDIHAVPFINTNSWIEIKNFYKEPQCPIFTPAENLSTKLAVFIELEPISFWIFEDIEKQIEIQSKDILGYQSYLDLIAYWLWQFDKDLKKCFQNNEFKLSIQISINYDYLLDSKDLSNKNENYPFKITITEDNGIEFQVLPGIYNLFKTPDNSGELYIIEQLLIAITQLLKNQKHECSSINLKRNIKSMIDSQKMIPQKKKLIILDAGNNPMLYPILGTHFRNIHKNDKNNILDEIGEFLRKKKNLKIDLIDKEKNNFVLNSVVEYCFGKLSKIIETLDPTHLLDFLVTHYEAVIYEREFRNLTIQTELACYSSIEHMTKQLSEQIQEIDEAALSCRFLIELVVTKPPLGNIPISFSIYDQIMALSHEIIFFGNLSDLDKFNLSNIELAILQSGRLGTNYSQTHKFFSSFSSNKSKEKIFESERYFPKYWDDKEIFDDDNIPNHVIELNEAFIAEFDICFTDINLLFSKIGDYCFDNNSEHMFEMEFNSFVKMFSSQLNWEIDKTIKIVNFLTLYPRKNFLNPDNFRSSDIFPWRMSRALSYLRRPLLIKLNNNNCYICWGMRHIFASLKYLLYSTVDGRLQDSYQSKKMREFLGQNKHNDGKTFNQKVYDSFIANENIIVKQTVKKIGKYRIGYPNNDLGDIDVLIININSKIIVVIECKDLGIARNAIEISRELEYLFIDKEKQVSTMTKHLRRVNWISDNINLVLNTFNILDHKRWKVDSFILVSSEMMAPHFHRSKVPVYSYSHFISDYLPSLYKMKK